MTRFGGAVSLSDAAAIDELYDTLRHLSFAREGDDGDIMKLALHEFQVRIACIDWCEVVSLVGCLRLILQRMFADCGVVEPESIH